LEYKFSENMFNIWYKVRHVYEYHISVAKYKVYKTDVFYNIFLDVCHKLSVLEGLCLIQVISLPYTT